MLQAADREQRQRQLPGIPRHIFLPGWQREQESDELQCDMERQFERIYARGAEVPQPAELEVSGDYDAELDLTLVDAEGAANLTAVSKVGELLIWFRFVCFELVGFMMYKYCTICS